MFGWQSKRILTQIVANIPPSMRLKAADYKKRLQLLEEQSQRRKHAVELLQEVSNVLFAARSTGMSRNTVQRIRKCIIINNTLKLERLTSNTICAGRPTVINYEDFSLIIQRLTHASERGLAVEEPVFKQILSRVNAKGRNGYKNGVSSDAAVRTYRAHNKNI